MLRNTFMLDEDKFRGLVHMHEYHNEKEITEYWSRVSGIPTKQFTKPYKKPHTGNRIKKDYMGSFRIRYYDAKIAKELTQVYLQFADFLTK